MPRLTCMPGVSRGTRTIDCCLCEEASGSVFPITMKILQLGFIAPEANHFRPLITYSEPSLTIDSEMFVASEDATSGSVIANADRIFPLINGSSHSLRCHSLPNMERTSMLPVSGAAQFVAVGAILGERPMISASGAYCRL